MNRRVIGLPLNFPQIVTLCGSSKFKDEFDYVAKVFTYHGWIVLSMCYFTHYEKTKGDPFVDRFDRIKPELDVLHKCKIDLADVVFIVNADGYIGASTQDEYKYALAVGKPVATFLNSVVNFMKLELK